MMRMEHLHPPSSPYASTTHRSSHLLRRLIRHGRHHLIHTVGIHRWQLRHGRGGVKIRLLAAIATLLPRRRPSHVINHVGVSPEEMLVIVRAAIRSLPSHALESPPVHLPDKALVSGLGEILRTDFLHEVFLVDDPPRSAVGHP